MKITENKFMRKMCAFTLSETLITLSIVGVVAILTLPVVIENYRGKAWTAAEGMFTSRLDRALHAMSQTGNLEGYGTTEEFVSSLKNFMDIKQVCDTDNLDDCFISKFKYDNAIINTLNLKEGYNLGMPTIDSSTIGMRTNFGVNALLVYDKKCKIEKDSDSDDAYRACVAAYVDTNGNAGPNKFSKDIRPINSGIPNGGTRPSEPEPVTGPQPSVLPPVNCVNEPHFEHWSGCKGRMLIVAETDLYGDGSSGEKLMNWYEAMAACEAIGMRLPTIQELRVIYQMTKDGTVTGIASADYWAETGYSQDPNIAQNVYMGAGNWGLAEKNSGSRHTRCVKN